MKKRQYRVRIKPALALGLILVTAIWLLVACKPENPDADSIALESRRLPTGAAGPLIANMAEDLRSSGYTQPTINHLVNGASANVFHEELATSENTVTVAPAVQKGAQTSLSGSASGIHSSADRLSAIQLTLTSIIGSLNGKITATSSIARTSTVTRSLTPDKALASIGQAYASVFEALAAVTVSNLDEAGVSAADMPVSVAAIVTTITSRYQNAGVGSSDRGAVFKAVVKGAVAALDDAGISPTAMKNAVGRVATAAIAGAKTSGLNNETLLALSEQITEGAISGLADAGVSTNDFSSYATEMIKGVKTGLTTAGLSAAEISSIDDTLT
jgi:hypothetical protein